MKKTAMTLSALVLAFAAGAQANINWDYVGGGYTDAGSDGPYVEGSYRLDSRWIVDGTFSRLSSGPFDVNFVQAGVNYLTGFKLDFSPTTQSYLLAGIEHASGDADNTGGYAGIGLRHPLTPQVELYSEATYHSMGDDHGSLAGGIAFYLSPDWAIRSNIALNSGDTKNEFRLGVTYQF
ncbi:outer membrane beta-barrel protein [Rheinheimera gaetbuli]